MTIDKHCVAASDVARGDICFNERDELGIVLELADGSGTARGVYLTLSGVCSPMDESLMRVWSKPGWEGRVLRKDGFLDDADVGMAEQMAKKDTPNDFLIIYQR